MMTVIIILQWNWPALLPPQWYNCLMITVRTVQIDSQYQKHNWMGKEGYVVTQGKWKLNSEFYKKKELEENSIYGFNPFLLFTSVFLFYLRFDLPSRVEFCQYKKVTFL